jgi:hypothetical protein
MRLPLRLLPIALGGEGVEGLLTSLWNETVGERPGMPTALGAASEGRAMEKRPTALGLLPSALVGDNRSNARGVPGEASDPQLLVVLEANSLPVNTLLGGLVRGLGQGEGEPNADLHCRRADRRRPAADVGGVALPGVRAEAAMPGVTLACTHTDHHLSVTMSKEQLTAWRYFIGRLAKFTILNIRNLN